MEDSNKPLIRLGSKNQVAPSEEFKPQIRVKGKRIGMPEVDLVFVIDTTGSMSDKIEGLLQTCANFVQEFSSLELDARIAVIAFGDLRVPGDRVDVKDFLPDISAVRAALRNIPRFGGGGNEGESSLEALMAAMSLNYRSKAVKALILITDEPAHQSELTAEAVASELTRKEFLVSVVSAPYGYFMKMAQQNGGEWYQISATTDFTKILEMFRRLAERVAKTVSQVHKLADGSVAAFLRLNPPK